jgi:hypothetical protein
MRAISPLNHTALDERPDMAYNVGTASYKSIPSIVVPTSARFLCVPLANRAERLLSAYIQPRGAPSSQMLWLFRKR